ncbi:type II toxin-antitoxin system VapC family toxin [Vibrio cholerae]|uniref:type II toxin-antitoxin system VapC family toxin n=1 Tax=Vibrio cholerae TaxID=666 RepID=UPI000AEE91B3|nr:type II toxin-antitoxin system VapC family toxin [Vibrio cholerae]EJL6509609.1 type II toxin-antitoxin system VapC family toxin [Vibrio cholerae]EKA4523359.1 type II toxin-antitoxin system VapC family toxin [Vibrio cholerae]MDP4497735.1 type II toxin-antitoxin system VapC family toxin [Vibrio cholerae]MEB5557834.1 hypothetical protein [Vibrio cholerae]WLP78828.1 type II toxin-antitoxin system VapC family toxin [Vibrio cholerae]
MKLSSNCPKSSSFFLKNRRMFLDSCIVNEMHLNPEIKDVIDTAGQYFSTYISAVSLLEVGFGPTSKADPRQQQAAIELYVSKDIKNVGADTVDVIDPIWADKSGRKFLYVPQQHEWYGARHKLIGWMDAENTGGSSARKQANDALIFMCAWNANSFLVTENVKDFNRFNRLAYREFGGHLPVFTISDLIKAKTDVVTFPDNLENYS